MDYCRYDSPTLPPLVLKSADTNEYIGAGCLVTDENEVERRKSVFCHLSARVTTVEDYHVHTHVPSLFLRPAAA